MKILNKTDQTYIAKRLAAIYYIACNWRTDDMECVEKVLDNVFDIAFRVGGSKMTDVGIPLLVNQLEMYQGTVGACKSPCSALKGES